ncbi:transcription repressor OFP1-like [Miscanthus floridulus]|uniref:transcription repressor OFP1-like n=1 Tax=Miscanthus floridulus TaxID=154761 RepID=UPI003458BA9C
MTWGIRSQHAAPSARCEGENAEERGSKGKGKGFSFSPLSWLAKLAAKEKPSAAAKRASTPTPQNTAAADPAFPSSCLPKRTSPSPAAVTVTPGSSSPPRRSTADAAVPRRLSVGNDNADSVAARRHGRRHCSVGGDRELPPLGRLIPFSLLAGGSSPARAAAAPSDTDAARAGARRHRRRRSSRRLSVSGGRRPSFSGRMPPPRVRVRSPRRAAPAELEGLAVVRRTRDPQRAFRESMVEMIATASGGGGPTAVPPRPEELERLLACYLSLNADEHHDCIVKVFRQVWFEYVNLLPRLEAGGRRRLPTARRC